MNALKHMEAIFTVALALSASAYIATSIPAAHANASQSSSAEAKIPQIVISAKRMTAAEKQASLDAERKSIAAATTAGSNI